MNKLEIFNKALVSLNQEPLGEEDLESSSRPEVMVLDLYLGSAIRKASREMDWSFLVVELQLGWDEGSKRGYAHSYPLPRRLLKLTWADGFNYETVHGLLLTDGEAQAYGIMEPDADAMLQDSFIPEDFWDLVAYALALMTIPKLSPGDKVMNEIASLYQTTLAGLVASDCQSSMQQKMEG